MIKIDENYFVKEATAKLAKEKGFNINTEKAYYETLAFSFIEGHHGDEVNMDYVPPRILENNSYRNKNDRKICNAPTQSCLQAWLRDHHKIFISIDTIIDEENKVSYEYMFFKSSKDKIDYLLKRLENEIKSFDFYEEALEECFFEVLTNLL